MDDVFIECFSDVSDPRIESIKKHLLLDIIAIAICGVLSGAETWQEIEDFASENMDWFDQFLTLPNGLSSHDTLLRVFSLLDPQAFQTSCLNWLNRITKLLPEGVLAIDGKSISNSRRVNSYQKAQHVINAWACANQVCLGQLKVDEKSN